MDPITVAARRFNAEAEAAWKAEPGRPVRIAATPADRGDLVKALRLWELAPDNRRPFFIFEEPYLDAEAYFHGLLASIADDYEQIRRGAGEDGVTLGTFGNMPAGASAAHRAALGVARAAALLGARFDGVVVALLPPSISEPRRFGEGIRMLAQPCDPLRVRLAILDAAGTAVPADVGVVTFAVDHRGLFDLLKRMGQLGADGDATAAAGGAPGPASRAAAGAALRAHLLAAAEATAQHRHGTAATEYRAARALCQTDARALEEVMVLLALGGACLAAEARPQAAEGFCQAMVLGRRAEAWALAAHGGLSAGAVFTMMDQREAAARVYDVAGSAAKRGGLSTLEEEAWRLKATCIREGRASSG